MTENKRFISHFSGHIIDCDSNNKLLNLYETVELMNKLDKENEQLKKEIVKFKEWEKHIGDVKREDLDKVFKMSIYEIAEGFEYYKKRIKELEE